MIISNYFHQEMDSEMKEFELVLKQLYMENRERALQDPHYMEEIQDIITSATKKCPNEFATLLVNQQLDEELFFHHGTDVEIFQHLRYLPASWHAHDFIEIACVLQGHCTNYILEQNLRMKEGDICIIAPGIRHAISAFSDDCLMLNFIIRTSTFETAFFSILDGNDILSDFFMRLLTPSKGYPYLLFSTGEDPELLNFIGYAYHEFQRNRQYNNRMMNSILNAFFITLLRNHGANVILPQTGSEPRDENTVLILKYMQDNYNTITLSNLAAFFNYSERQIQRIIKSSTGMSFSENIQKLKLRQAARLLMNPARSVASIAEELGYADPGNFRYIFKKYYGMTPLEYRAEKNI